MLGLPRLRLAMTGKKRLAMTHPFCHCEERQRRSNLWARFLVPFRANSTIGNEIATPEPALSGKILRYAQNDSK